MVPAYRFKKEDESLCTAVLELRIKAFEVFGIDPVKIRTNVSECRGLPRQVKRTVATFVPHIFRTTGLVILPV